MPLMPTARTPSTRGSVPHQPSTGRRTKGRQVFAAALWVALHGTSLSASAQQRSPRPGEEAQQQRSRTRTLQPKRFPLVEARWLRGVDQLRASRATPRGAKPGSKASPGAPSADFRVGKLAGKSPFHRKRYLRANPDRAWLWTRWGAKKPLWRIGKEVECWATPTKAKRRVRGPTLEWALLRRQGTGVILERKQGYFDPNRCVVVQQSRSTQRLVLLLEHHGTPLALAARSPSGLLILFPPKTPLSIGGAVHMYAGDIHGPSLLEIELGQGKSSTVVAKFGGPARAAWSALIKGPKQPALSHLDTSHLRIDATQTIGEAAPTILLAEQQTTGKRQSKKRSTRDLKAELSALHKELQRRRKDTKALRALAKAQPKGSLLRKRAASEWRASQTRLLRSIELFLRKERQLERSEGPR